MYRLRRGVPAGAQMGPGRDARLEDVFGVSSRPVRSYVEREHVDERFKDSLRSGKQIIVYGASKQGKTALVQKHLPTEDSIVISLSPKTKALDIYRIILASAGVRIASTT